MFYESEQTKLSVSILANFTLKLTKTKPANMRNKYRLISIFGQMSIVRRSYIPEP